MCGGTEGGAGRKRGRRTGTPAVHCREIPDPAQTQRVDNKMHGHALFDDVLDSFVGHRESNTLTTSALGASNSPEHWFSLLQRTWNLGEGSLLTIPCVGESVSH